MDLENLKSEWSAMNDRMEKQEIFKEKMFCQMLNTKSDKSLNRLVALEVINLIGSILSIPFCIYVFNKNGMELMRPFIIGGIIVLIICVILYSIKILILSKIDFTKTLKNNLLYINKYSICTKYEKLFIYYVLIPVAFASGVFYYAKMHVSLYWWILLSCVGIAMIIFTIYIFRLYNKNISIIQQNLEGLRELEEK